MKAEITIEKFTDLNMDCNLTEFILYMQDIGAIALKGDLKQDTGIELSKIHEDWLKVTKEELKERNESIGV